MKKIILLCSLPLLTWSCGRFGNEDQKKEHEQRIVSIAKQYSEIIYALEAQKDLVAVDISSTYPPEIKKLPTIGYHRALSAESILAAKPTLILHDNNIGPEHVIRQLEELKIPMKHFDYKGDNLENTKGLIREIGVYFGKEKRAEELCSDLDKDIKFSLEAAIQYKDTPNVLVIHFGQASNIYLVVTESSTAAKMIKWAGGKMAVSGKRGMRQLSAEVVAAANPDVILLTDFGYDRLDSRENIELLPGISGTSAAKNGRIYRVEQHDLIYLGPRTGKTVLMLQKLIHRHEVE